MPRSGLKRLTRAPMTVAALGSVTLPVMEAVSWAKSVAAARLRGLRTTGQIEMSWSLRSAAGLASSPQIDEWAGRASRNSSPRRRGFSLSSEKGRRGGGRIVYTRLRVDSRTTSSGATLRWVAEDSRFSRTALMPSTTMVTAVAPIDSMGWRTVVRGGA